MGVYALWYLSPFSHFVVGTFALDGPERCSGLPVVRYDATAMGRELGPGYVSAGRGFRRPRHTWRYGPALLVRTIRETLSVCFVVIPVKTGTQVLCRFLDYRFVATTWKNPNKPGSPLSRG